MTSIEWRNIIQLTHTSTLKLSTHTNTNKHHMKNPRHIKAKYLCCIWCGNDIPKDKPYAKYCSNKCERLQLKEAHEAKKLHKLFKAIDQLTW